MNISSIKQGQKNWTTEEVSIVHNNYGKLSYKEMQNLLPGRSIFQIRNKSNYDGLCSKNNLRKYSVNKEYFNIPTQENCYWAGFIAADGCIRDIGALAIKIKEDDSDLLKKFTADIKYTNSPKYRNGCVEVTINCIEICRALEKNFNITPRKSKTLRPPLLDDENLISCFIKGVIDGDGSVMNNSIIVYGTKDLLEWIKYYFDKWIPESNYYHSQVRKIQSHLHAYKVSSKRNEYIFNMFKQLNCYELKRKWSVD